jgi:hypothetical protein
MVLLLWSVGARRSVFGTGIGSVASSTHARRERRSGRVRGAFRRDGGECQDDGNGPRAGRMEASDSVRAPSCAS